MDSGNYRKYEPVFGSYYIKKKIGQGSYGGVYEIERNDHGRIYRSALKIISIPQDESEYKSLQLQGADKASISSYYDQVLEGIISENELMDELKGHSNIVSYEYHKVIPHEEVGFDVLIRMELLTPLLDYLIDHPMEEKSVIQLGIDICKALEVCHKKGIIHRDIKPQNILVNHNGDFKLGDFGIAKVLEHTSVEMSKKGTYSYMAPEIYKGQNYGLVVDIYSLGIVLYYLMNGNRVPFLDDNGSLSSTLAREDAINKRMAGTDLPLLPNASKEFNKIILKACAYQPWDRYLSATEMRKALEKLTSDASEVTVIEHPEPIKTDSDRTQIQENHKSKKSGIKRWCIASFVTLSIACVAFIAIPRPVTDIAGVKDGESIKIVQGESKRYECTIEQKGFIKADLQCNSEDSEILSIKKDSSDSKIVIDIDAEKLGKTKVTFTAKSITKTIDVKVIPKVTKISNVDDLWLTVGQTVALEPKLAPQKYADEKIFYKSEDNKIVKADESGRVTAVSAGATKIVINAGGCKKCVTVSVSEPVVYSSSSGSGNRKRKSKSKSKSYSDENGWAVFE